MEHAATVALSKAGSEEVRVLQRSSSALQTEMPATTRARPHEPAWNWGKAAKVRRIRAPLRYPAADDIIADMSTLELSDEQVISLVRGLPAERKRAALLALAQEAQAGREDRLRWAEAQLRRASAQRGLEWDRLSEDERESFVDTLLHEK